MSGKSDDGTDDVTEGGRPRPPLPPASGGIRGDSKPSKSGTDKPGAAAEPPPPPPPPVAPEPGEVEGRPGKAKLGLLIGGGLLLLAGVAAGLVLLLGGGDDSSSGPQVSANDLDDGEIARVEEVPDGRGNISEEAFNRAFEQASKAAPDQQDLKDSVVDRLLFQAWVVGEADERELEVTEQEIDEEMNLIKEQQELEGQKEFRRFVRRAGLTMDEARFQVKISKLQEKIQDDIQNSVTEVPESRIEDFYEEEKASFTVDGETQPLDEVRDQIEEQLLPTIQQEAMTEFEEEFIEKWTARTVCAEGYVTDSCSNYVKPDDESDGSSEDQADLGKRPQIEASDDPPPAELEIEDIVVGDGAVVEEGDKLSVQYVGALYESGEEFDASWDSGDAFAFTFGGGEVIPGWEQGLEGMKVGGRRKLVIPPDLAYGEAGQGADIPPNSTLVFVVDIESAD